MKIANNRIERVVGLYKPELRYLIEAWEYYTTGRGLFHVRGTEYMGGVNHLTEVAAQTCVNQWGQAFFANHVDYGRVENFNGIAFDDFMADIKERVVIAESRKRFRRSAGISEPFYGEFAVNEIRKHGKNHLFKLDFSLAEGAVDGELTVVLKYPK